LQVVTGPLSDRIGRKALIAGGMVVQAGGIWLTVLVPAYAAWLAGAVLQGVGTAMVYPTLLAVIGDDWLGMAAAIHVVAGLTLLSGLVVALRMRETRPETGI
jgi:MFS family permease